MPRKTLAKHFFDKLTLAGWPGITLDERRQIVTCAKGNILSPKNGKYHLNFFWFSSEKNEYNQREKYGEIIFPKAFNIRNLIYFRTNGNFKGTRLGE